ncbi:MAG: outer membrane beta-barrel protein [Gemmatimonadetes bacterium]|nr:outer membrane beta-barrel protein [Gemmatimonadota bacterium]
MRRILGAVAMLAVASAPVLAQQTTRSPVGFGAVGGISVPVGDLGDISGTGWHLGAIASYMPGLGVLGGRADIVYHSFGAGRTPFLGSTIESDISAITGTANLVLTFAGTDPAAGGTTYRPYVIGGLGFYNMRVDQRCVGTGCPGGTSASGSNTEFGFNAGGGIRFAFIGMDAFAEARFHRVGSSIPGGSTQGQQAASFIPISVGLNFR